MMMHEFTERTGYEPSSEEYRLIEESYYDFPGGKNEFCRQWLQDHEDGHWEREMNLRQQIDQMKSDHQKEIADLDDSLKFYRPFFERATKAEKKATILDLVSEETANCEIRVKGAWTTYKDVKVTYISKSYNGQFEFINITRKSGLTFSIKLDDIETIIKIG